MISRSFSDPESESAVQGCRHCNFVTVSGDFYQVKLKNPEILHESVFKDNTKKEFTLSHVSVTKRFQGFRCQALPERPVFSSFTVTMEMNSWREAASYVFR